MEPYRDCINHNFALERDTDLNGVYPHVFGHEKSFGMSVRYLRLTYVAIMAICGQNNATGAQCGQRGGDEGQFR